MARAASTGLAAAHTTWTGADLLHARLDFSTAQPEPGPQPAHFVGDGAESRGGVVLLEVQGVAHRGGHVLRASLRAHPPGRSARSRNVQWTRPLRIGGGLYDSVKLL